MHQARSIATPGTETGRTVLRFDSGLWGLIETVAESEGIHWRTWITRTLTEHHGSEANIIKTKFIREKAEAAYDTILEREMHEGIARLERGEIAEGADDAPDHPFVNRLMQMTEEEVTEHIQRTTPVFSLPGDAFTIHLTTWYDIPALLIENRIRGGISYVFVERPVA